jgi:hypothetical protein
MDFPKRSQKHGSIEIEKGAFPLPKEQKAADFLTNFGYDILFLKRTNTQGVKSADIYMRNEKWEIKTIESKKKTTVDKRIREGLDQAPNLVIDLRKNKDNGSTVLSEILLQFRITKDFEKLIIIQKNKTILEFL